MLYTSKSNDRKFSSEIGGGYKAATYLNNATRTSYSPAVNAINADQIIFDENSLGFKPYYAQAAEMSNFGSTSATATIDVMNLPSTPIAMVGGYGGRTYAIVVNRGVPYFYNMQFYNVADIGDFSADGANSIINLSGCQDILNIKYLEANHHGTAFYYATDNAVYSFSPSSGQTTQNTIYTCSANETITCINVFYGDGGGGFPTAGSILWIGVWDEGAQEGKLVEYEMDVNNGVAIQTWGPMFAPPHSNPQITTGFGKI